MTLISHHRSRIFLFLLIIWWVFIYFYYRLTWFDSKEGPFYLGIGVFTFYLLFKTRKTPFQSSKIFFLFILIYFATALLSLLKINTSFYEGMLEYARLFLWLLLSWAFTQLEEFEWTKLISYAIIAACIIVILNTFGLHGVSIFPHDEGSLIPIGQFTFYGDFTALHLPAAFYLLFQSIQNYREKENTPSKNLNSIFVIIFWSLCSLILLFGLWISGTRASILGVLMGLFVVLFTLKKLKHIHWKFIVYTILGVLILTSFFQMIQPINARNESTLGRFHIISQIESEKTLETASASRWSLYKKTFNMIKAAPVLGWGLGNYLFVIPEYFEKKTSGDYFLRHPHNEILHQLSTVGIIGLISFLGFWITFFYLIFQNIKSLSTKDTMIALMALSGVIISCVSWQFSTNFVFSLSRLLTAFYGGISFHYLLKTSSISKLKKTTPLALRFRGKRTIMGFTIISTVFLSAHSLSLYYCNLVLSENNSYLKSKWANRAYFLSPRAFDPLYLFIKTHLDLESNQNISNAVEAFHHQFFFVPEAQFQVARAYLKLGKKEEVKKIIEQVLKNDPTHFAAKVLLTTLKAE